MILFLRLAQKEGIKKSKVSWIEAILVHGENRTAFSSEISILIKKNRLPGKIVMAKVASMVRKADLIVCADVKVVAKALIKEMKFRKVEIPDTRWQDLLIAANVHLARLDVEGKESISDVMSELDMDGADNISLWIAIGSPVSATHKFKGVFADLPTRQGF